MFWLCRDGQTSREWREPSHEEQVYQIGRWETRAWQVEQEEAVGVWVDILDNVAWEPGNRHEHSMGHVILSLLHALLFLPGLSSGACVPDSANTPVVKFTVLLLLQHLHLHVALCTCSCHMASPACPHYTVSCSSRGRTASRAHSTRSSRMLCSA